MSFLLPSRTFSTHILLFRFLDRFPFLCFLLLTFIYSAVDELRGKSRNREVEVELERLRGEKVERLIEVEKEKAER